MAEEGNNTPISHWRTHNLFMVTGRDGSQHSVSEGEMNRGLWLLFTIMAGFAFAVGASVAAGAELPKLPLSD